MARIDKISQEIKRELGFLIPQLKDPRIPGMVSVTAVHVTGDLSFATVYVSIMGDEQKQIEAVKGLNSAKSFVRREIAQKVKLRATPEFAFVADDSIEHGAHINDLLNQMKRDG